MELSVFLAKAWGLYLLIISLAFLVNRKNYQAALQVLKNKAARILAGFILLVIGILSIISHNIWTADWRGLITLFGWITLIKGIHRLFWPKFVIRQIKKLKIKKWMNVALFLSFILGAYLTYIGFFFFN